MFSKLLIILLLLTTVGFAWLAVRNAQLLSCDRLITTDTGSTVCLINLGNVSDRQQQQLVKTEMESHWQY